MYEISSTTETTYADSWMLTTNTRGKYSYLFLLIEGFPGSSKVKNLLASTRDEAFIPGLEGTIPWRRAWEPTQVFVPGKSHGQRRLAGYSPLCHKEMQLNNYRSEDRVLKSTELAIVVRKAESRIKPINTIISL